MSQNNTSWIVPGQSTLAAGSIRSDSNKCNQCLNMDHCFNSTDTFARNATVMYESSNHDYNWWDKPNPQASLPNCTSSSPPSNNSCIVCVKKMTEIVYAVCRNVSKTAQMIMEAPGHNIIISESECPDLRSHSPVNPDSVQLATWIIVVISLIVLFVAICVVYKRRQNSGGDPDEVPGRGGETMSLGWPGNASRFPRKSWKKCLVRGKSGCPSLDCCPRDPAPDMRSDQGDETQPEDLMLDDPSVTSV